MGSTFDEAEAADYVQRHPRMRAAELLSAAIAEIRPLRALRATVEIALDECEAEDLPPADALAKLTKRLRRGFDPDLD